jgi:hypothetical protein
LLACSTTNRVDYDRGVDVLYLTSGHRSEKRLAGKRLAG